LKIQQFERCVQALDNFIKQKSSVAGQDSEAVATARRVSQARSALRQRQLFITAFGGGVGLVLVLISFVLPWTWSWLILGTGGCEAVGHLITELIFNRKHLCTKSQGSSKGHALPKLPSVSVESGQVDGVGSNHHSTSGEGRTVTLGIFKSRKKGKAWKIELSKIAEENSRAPLSTNVSQFNTS
jgi:hypothetical protein